MNNNNKKKRGARARAALGDKNLLVCARTRAQAAAMQTTKQNVDTTTVSGCLKPQIFLKEKKDNCLYLNVNLFHRIELIPFIATVV